MIITTVMEDSTRRIMKIKINNYECYAIQYKNGEPPVPPPPPTPLVIPFNFCYLSVSQSTKNWSMRWENMGKGSDIRLSTTGWNTYLQQGLRNWDTYKSTFKSQALSKLDADVKSIYTDHNEYLKNKSAYSKVLDDYISMMEDAISRFLADVNTKTVYVNIVLVMHTDGHGHFTNAYAQETIEIYYRGTREYRYYEEKRYTGEE